MATAAAVEQPNGKPVGQLRYQQAIEWASERAASGSCWLLMIRLMERRAWLARHLSGRRPFGGYHVRSRHNWWLGERGAGVDVDAGANAALKLPP